MGWALQVALVAVFTAYLLSRDLTAPLDELTRVVKYLENRQGPINDLRLTVAFGPRVT